VKENIINTVFQIQFASAQICALYTYSGCGYSNAKSGYVGEGR